MKNCRYVRHRMHWKKTQTLLQTGNVQGDFPPFWSRNKTVSSSYHSTRSSYSSCCSWSKSDYCRNRCGVAMMEQHVRCWTLRFSGIAGGLRWTFRRHPHHSARCSRLSASLYLGKRSRSSFSASSQVQELLWQVAALNLKPQFAQMQCSPYLEWIETAMNEWITQDGQRLYWQQHEILMNRNFMRYVFYRIEISRDFLYDYSQWITYLYTRTNLIQQHGSI